MAVDVCLGVIGRRLRIRRIDQRLRGVELCVVRGRLRNTDRRVNSVEMVSGCVAGRDIVDRRAHDVESRAGDLIRPTILVIRSVPHKSMADVRSRIGLVVVDVRLSIRRIDQGLRSVELCVVRGDLCCTNRRINAVEVLS